MTDGKEKQKLSQHWQGPRRLLIPGLTLHMSNTTARPCPAWRGAADDGTQNAPLTAGPAGQPPLDEAEMGISRVSVSSNNSGQPRNKKEMEQVIPVSTFRGKRLQNCAQYSYVRTDSRLSPAPSVLVSGQHPFKSVQ